VKFTERGGVTVQVSRVPGGDGEYLRIEVRDTGSGIPSGSLPTIFEPFEQAGDSESRSMGTGLGLPISQQIVQMMGGAVRVESSTAEPSGSAFTVTVPLVPCDHEAVTPSLLTDDARPEAMIAPGREELEALHEMALSGNMGAIAERAASLATRPALAPFARRLAALAGAFDDQRVDALLEDMLAAAEE